MLTTATPAAAASEITFTALVVRAGSGDWTAWQGTGAQAPGIRFTRSAAGSGTLTETATITFTPSGSGSVSVSELFTVYDGMVVSVPTHLGSTYIFTVPVSLAAGGHKGITIKDNAAANGTYGISFGGGSATLAIRNAGSSSHEVKSPRPSRSRFLLTFLPRHEGATSTARRFSSTRWHLNWRCWPSPRWPQR